MRGVRGRPGFRRREKIAGIGGPRRHAASLQRGRASSENHRYAMDEGASRVRENVLVLLVGFSGTRMAHLTYSSV
jgi:hypothetical protein